MSQSQVVKLVAKPLWTGALGAVTAYYVLGDDGIMIIANRVVPGWFAIGGSIALASYVSELFDEFLLPKIPENPYASYEAMVIPPVTAGLATWGVLSLGSTISNINFTRPFALGAGSQLLSNATFDSWIAPMIQNY